MSMSATDYSRQYQHGVAAFNEMASAFQNDDLGLAKVIFTITGQRDAMKAANVVTPWHDGLIDASDEWQERLAAFLAKNSL